MKSIRSNGIPILLATVTIAASIAAPPARGAMIAVALGDTPAIRLIDQPNVRLLGPGRIPGSLIISAEFGGLWRIAIRNRILLLNGAATLCAGRAMT